MISIMTACGALAIIPFGDTRRHLRHQVGLYGIDVSIGPLYLFAFGAIAFYGIMLGGWASGSKYSFLGAMRAAAQLISYEVAQGLALVGVVMTAGHAVAGRDRRGAGGHVVHHPAVRRLHRLPRRRLRRDEPRRRSTCPRPTPSSSAATTPSTAAARFAAYYFAEYLNMLVVSAIVTTVFLGGWLLPFGIDPPTWVDPIVVLVKMLVLRLLLHLGARDAAAPALRPADELRLEGPAAAGHPQRPRHRDPRGGDLTDAPGNPDATTSSRSQRGPEPGGAGGAYRAFGETLRGLKTTFGRAGRGPDDDPVPRGEGAGLPALPRPPPAAPLRGHRPGEVRRLLAVRRRLPGRLHPRRRRREHARAPRLAPASATRRSTRSTCRAASSAATARSRARSTRSRWATTTRCRTTTART